MSGPAKLRLAAPWLQVDVTTDERDTLCVRASCVHCGVSQFETIDAAGGGLNRLTVGFTHAAGCVVPERRAAAAAARWN